MTDDELSAIECVDAFVYPGPWTHETMHLDCREAVDVWCHHPDGEQGRGRKIAKVILRSHEPTRQLDMQTLFFICNAREAVPALCAEVRRSWARIEELESERDRMHKDLIEVEKNYEQLLARMDRYE